MHELEVWLIRCTQFSRILFKNSQRERERDILTWHFISQNWVKTAECVSLDILALACAVHHNITKTVAFMGGFMRSSSKHLSSVIMFWAIDSDGTVMRLLPPHFIEAGMKIKMAADLKILEEVLLPWIKKNHDPMKVMFIQDFGHAHGSKAKVFPKRHYPLFVPSNVWSPPRQIWTPVTISYGTMLRNYQNIDLTTVKPPWISPSGVRFSTRVNYQSLSCICGLY